MHLLRCSLALLALSVPAASPYFRIQVVDAATGRGVPLVELETVDRAKWITDNAGLVAFHEPGLMDRKVFFSVRSHGYVYPKDGFGMAGVAFTPQAGERVEIRIRRVNIAERLYRITGAGLYRDSVLLGERPPLREPLLNAEVLGQDSVQTAVYRGRIHWLWGDTQRARYPLGHFWTAGATSELPDKGGLAPGVGIDLTYFADADGFSRGMWPRPKEGLIWTDGLVAVPDAQGRERLVARGARMKDLGHLLSHELGVYDDEKNLFERATEYPLDETWRCPSGQGTRDGSNVYFQGSTKCLAAFPAVRVAARYEDVKNPAAYEAFTCLSEGAPFAGGKTRIERDAAGHPVYRWTKHAPPLNADQERELVKAGTIAAEDARYQPCDIESGKPVAIHAGSVHWNAFRKKWILIASQLGGTSMLGEIWYGEAEAVTGPWKRVRKIVTHDKYSFYNPVHHPFFDQDGGRIVYFEGTYTTTFSGNASPTPRYEYNQIMYRLDLADERLNMEKK